MSTTPPTPHPLRTRIEIYTDTAGRHRWRKKAANMLITASSSQGYMNRRSCLLNLQHEQGGTYYPDETRELVRRPDFVRGKRRLGVLNRDNGQQVPVIELEATQ